MQTQQKVSLAADSKCKFTALCSLEPRRVSLHFELGFDQHSTDWAIYILQDYSAGIIRKKVFLQNDNRLVCANYITWLKFWNNSRSSAILHAFPTVKPLFRKLNTTVPSSAPKKTMFSKELYFLYQDVII